MKLTDILRDLEGERDCEVITSWKEILIRVKLPIRWVSTQERLVSFYFRSFKFKHVFSDRTPVYIKIGEIFLICKVYSNVGDELVLEVDAPVPAPPIILRDSIRVETTEKEPVYVSFYVEDKCITKAKAVDISESGVGIIIHKEEANTFMDILSEIATEPLKIHTLFNMEIELPKEGTVKAQGELKNIISREGDVYIRLGFRITMEEEYTKKIRQYIMRRQREILEQLKSL